MENLEPQLHSPVEIPERIALYEFYYTYTEFLVELTDDDFISESYRLFPEEKRRVEQYIIWGYDVATIWEQGDTDIDETVSFGYESNHPSITGYLILKSLQQ